jgi:hypothetical protein
MGQIGWPRSDASSPSRQIKPSNARAAGIQPRQERSADEAIGTGDDGTLYRRGD